MKTISFEEHVRHFGHPKSDYKKDGTLKKNRAEPRIYYIPEKVEHECEEVVVDGNFLGYIKTDCEYGPLFNDKGKCVNVAYATFSGDTLHENGFSFYRGKKTEDGLCVICFFHHAGTLTLCGYATTKEIQNI